MEPDLTLIGKIKDAMRAAQSADELVEVASSYRQTVQALSESETGRVHAIHLANLKLYRLEQFEKWEAEEQDRR